jgi:hypothetical protein
MLAPSLESSNGTKAERPLPGDKGFLDYTASVHLAGHITTAEALERERVHALILGKV